MTPSIRSNPVFFNNSFSLSPLFWLFACAALSFATNSELSFAAFTAKVFGMTRSASAYSCIASCSRESSVVEYSSRCTESAASTAPPPGTNVLLSSIRFTTQSESCRARSISSNMYSLAPRSTTVEAPPPWHPYAYNISPSPMRSSRTASHVPRQSVSNVSFPSMSAIVTTTFPPVALARRLRSSLLHRRAHIMPASTKYFMQRSSTPLVVRTTRAPASMIFRILSLVMSISLFLMFSISAGSFTMTCTPMAMRWRCRFMSSMAIFTGPASGDDSTAVGMPCAARMALIAKPPARREDSNEDLP
mmetsp:Transcript_40114/g.120970  ORF Transcript_40114/g.120970 Transcript_40114/m.120970 type:complete len:304 (+) Transcript_40114:344-1255(+)